MKIRQRIFRNNSKKADARVMFLYWMSLVLIIISLSIGACILIYQDYQHRLDQAAHQGGTFAQALGEQTADLLASIGTLGEAVVEGRAKTSEDKQLSDLLRSLVSSETMAIIGIATLDDHGVVRASSLETLPEGESLSHTFEFLTLKKHPSEPFIINHPASGQFNTPNSCDGLTMTYSIPLVDADHRFQGIVLILINENFLYDFYSRLDLRADIALGLVGVDGIVRASNFPEAIGHNLGAPIINQLERDSRIQYAAFSGGNMLFAFHSAGKLPFWAFSGIPTSPIKSAAAKSAFALLATLAILYAMMIAFGLILTRYIKNRQELTENAVNLARERQNREFFQSIINAKHIIAAVCDASGKILIANDTFVQKFGKMEGKGEPLGKIVGENLDDPRLEFPLSKTAIINDASGKRIEIDWNISVIYDETGALRNFVVLGADITERRERELSIYQSSKLITLGEMATSIAHEVNQPLATMAMVLDNLEADLVTGKATPSQLKHELGVMSNQVERAASIVEHMRIYGRKADDTFEDFDPHIAVDGALTIIRARLEKEQITVKVKHGGDGCGVFANRLFVEQILLNLLANARDSIQERQLSNDKSPGEIHITVEKTSADQVTISVRDNGAGIPFGIADRLFDPFFTTKPVGKGTGLGLALGYGMAKDMNGRLEGGNWENGAIFTLYLTATAKQESTGHAT